MWNETELLQEIDTYYDGITVEEFLLDLEKAKCLDYVDDLD